MKIKHLWNQSQLDLYYLAMYILYREVYIFSFTENIYPENIWGCKCQQYNKGLLFQ